MRILILFLMLVCGARAQNAIFSALLSRPATSGTGAGYALVSATAGFTNSSEADSPAMDTRGANLIICCVGSYASTSFTLTDSLGNTWTALTTYGGSAATCKLFYCLSPLTGSAQTFKVTGVFAPTISIAAFSRSSSSTFDVSNGSSGSGTSINPGSITPSQDNEIIITGVVADNTSNSSIDSGFTIAAQASGQVGISVGSMISYKFQTSASASNPTATNSGAITMAVSIAAFK
jgi:hypothetical protein